MSPIKIAITHMGNPTNLARYLGVTTQAVCFWRDGKRKIPPEICIQIEKGTSGAVRCNDLRPDVEWSYIRPEHTKAILKPATQPAGQGV